MKIEWTKAGGYISPCWRAFNPETGRLLAVVKEESDGLYAAFDCGSRPYAEFGQFDTEANAKAAVEKFCSNLAPL